MIGRPRNKIQIKFIFLQTSPVIFLYEAFLNRRNQSASILPLCFTLCVASLASSFLHLFLPSSNDNQNLSFDTPVTPSQVSLLSAQLRLANTVPLNVFHALLVSLISVLLTFCSKYLCLANNAALSARSTLQSSPSSTYLLSSLSTRVRWMFLRIVWSRILRLLPIQVSLLNRHALRSTLLFLKKCHAPNRVYAIFPQSQIQNPKLFYGFEIIFILN